MNDDDDMFGDRTFLEEKENDKCRLLSTVDDKLKHEQLDSKGYVPNLRQLSDRMPNLVDNLFELDIDLKTTNEMMRQLAIACEMRIQLSKCISEQQQQLPISCSYKINWLSTGTWLISMEVWNRFDHPLDNWILNVSLISLDENYRDSIIGKHIALPLLQSQCRYSVDVMHTEVSLIPTIVCTELSQSFAIDCDYRTITLQFDRQLITSWHLIRSDISLSIVPTIDNMVTLGDAEISIDYPESLVYLLCGGRRATELGLYQWLLPNCSTYDDVIIGGEMQLKLRIDIRLIPDEGIFRLTIIINNKQWCNRLDNDLKMRIVMYLSGCDRFPKHTISTSTLFTDQHSMNDLYRVLMLKFGRK